MDRYLQNSNGGAQQILAVTLSSNSPCGFLNGIAYGLDDSLFNF